MQIQYSIIQWLAQTSQPDMLACLDDIIGPICKLSPTSSATLILFCMETKSYSNAGGAAFQKILCCCFSSHCFEFTVDLLPKPVGRLEWCIILLQTIFSPFNGVVVMHKMLWGPINKAGRGALKKYFGSYWASYTFDQVKSFF